MNTKLTLIINHSIINEIKKYAQKSHVSLSSLVETYFQTLISTKSISKIKKVTPITESLIGVVKLKNTKSDKQLLKEALIKKSR